MDVDVVVDGLRMPTTDSAWPRSARPETIRYGRTGTANSNNGHCWEIHALDDLPRDEEIVMHETP
jgi:hypothetical protein